MIKLTQLSADTSKSRRTGGQKIRACEILDACQGDQEALALPPLPSVQEENCTLEILGASQEEQSALANQKVAHVKSWIQVKMNRRSEFKCANFIGLADNCFDGTKFVQCRRHSDSLLEQSI